MICYGLCKLVGVYQLIGDIGVVLLEIVWFVVDVGDGVEYVQYWIVGDQQGGIGGSCRCGYGGV